MLSYNGEQSLSENSKLSVKFLSNSNYPGDTIKGFLKFENIGEKVDRLTTGDEFSGNNEETSHDDSEPESFKSRVSGVFSRASISDELLMDQKKPHDGTELFLSGSFQLFGYFSVNSEIIDIKKFEKLKSESIISGCIGGIPSLKISQAANKSFFQNISTLLSGEISEIDSFLRNNDASFNNIYPIFSTNQILVFSAFKSAPGDVKQYYMEFKIPDNLPPSYQSKNISVHYKLIFNAEKITDGKPLNINVSFPLNISIPNPAGGFQVVPDLSKEFIFNKKLLQGKFSNNKIEEVSKNYSDSSFLKNLKNEQLADVPEAESDENAVTSFVDQNCRLKKEFINTMKALINERDLTTTEQLKSLPNSPFMDNYGFSGLSIQSALDRKQSATSISSSTTKDNDHKYEPALIEKYLKNQYVIKFKNKFVCKLLYDKTYYSVGDPINISFDFTNIDPSIESHIISGVTIELESFEKVHYDYLLEYEEPISSIYNAFQENPENSSKIWNVPKSQSTGEYRKLSVDEINESDEIEKIILDQNPHYWNSFFKTHWIRKYSMLSSKYSVLNASNLVIAYNLPPQFSTNFFRLRYALVFKFVIVHESTENGNEVYLQKINENENGTLYSAKNSLSGSTFSIKLPINIVGK